MQFTPSVEELPLCQILSKPVCPPPPFRPCVVLSNQEGNEGKPTLLQRITFTALDANAAKCAHCPPRSPTTRLQGRSPPSLSQTLSDGEARKARSPPLLPLSLHHRMGVGHTILLAWHEREICIPRAPLPSFLSSPVILPVRLLPFHLQSNPSTPEVNHESQRGTK